jgi:hypothetical protein
VVGSKDWDNAGTANVGAVTWGNGSTGIRGPVTTTNSLVGTSANDNVGNSGVTALPNGNYVVRSKDWDNEGIVECGAVTWGNGSAGIRGPVTPINSLVGTSAFDQVGLSDVTVLTNGSYVVRSVNWNNGDTELAGAVTWGNGSTGISGRVTSTNSLVGTSANDNVGSDGVAILTNGNYLVKSATWNNGTIEDAGAVTWGSGSTGISGSVAPANSLVGTSTNDNVGGSGVTALTNGHYLVYSMYWDNETTEDAGAISLCDGQTGTTGPVNRRNSVLGTISFAGTGFDLAYDPTQHKLIIGQRESNLVTLFFGDCLRSLGKSSQDAPGASDIAFSKPGFTAVNADGSALTNFTLIGSGAASGKNSALFAFDPALGTDMVLQSGTPLSTLSGGLPFNAVATDLGGQLFQQPGRALFFQGTVKGTGITTANNRLLLQDNGIGVSLLHRTGSPIAALGGASLSSFSEVLQSHDQDLITVAYKLKSGGGVSAANDEGLIFLDHNGTVSANIAAREDQVAFGGGGNFGSFNGRAAAGLGSVIHFTALFKPAGLAAPVPAVFSTTVDGVTTARLAKAGDTHTSSGSASFKSFTAISQQDGNVLFKATLNNSPTSQNEGLFRLPPGLLTRKGDPIGGGLTISSILRFWPAGSEQVILQVQLAGLGVKSSNNQALLLRQSGGTYLTLLRTGLPAPGTGPATLATISAVEVNPVTGLYAVLGALGGASATSNQALWTGNPILALGSPESEQLPKLTLRKGNTYRTEVTPQGVIRSLALKPATDPTGAGGRGLAQALAANGDLAIFITGDRNLTEVVLLDR